MFSYDFMINTTSNRDARKVEKVEKTGESERKQSVIQIEMLLNMLC